uniref:DUF4939 domain-containing protein n=1 Tax=Pygocentrus nattereri TaxID=42514 RepID=A0AAR2JKV0_PYGNA
TQQRVKIVILRTATQQISALAHQQAEQSQLTPLVTSVKGLTRQLQTLNLTETDLNIVTPMAAVSGPLVIFPMSKFEGNPDKSQGFLLQCSVFFDNFPASNDQAKISFLVSRLSDKALEWATASWIGELLAKLRKSLSKAPELLQCDWSQLSPEERLHRSRNRLCLYCGNTGCDEGMQTEKPET